MRQALPALRRNAEEFLKRTPEDPSRGSLAPDLQEVLYELQVHEVELLMQNDALREAQAELERSHERYRGLFEHAPVAYLTLDGMGRITDTNVAATAMFGLDKAELLGEMLASFLNPDHAETFEQHRRKVAADGAPCSCELQLLCADGEPREVRLESLRTHQPEIEWRTAIVDLTQFNLLARQLEHAQRLEALGRLASGIAHDFNNLLMAALGCTEFALRAVPDNSDARMPLERLQALVLRGRSTVAELLTFARPDNGQAPNMEVDRVLQECLPALRTLLGDDVNLELKLRAGNAGVQFDGSRLERILLNLASNARHAMPKGGRFRLETRVVPSTRLLADARAALGNVPAVRISVSDTGSGMDTATRKRAFEPFFTTKPAAEGTGLGLSMVYSMVKQAGGHVELMSRPDVGTELAIYLPHVQDNQAAETEASRDRAAQSDNEPITVLVVDDDRLVRATICHYLLQTGHRVLEASQADEALAVAHTEPIDLLISDVVLPGMNGAELAAAVGSELPGLPVLLVSAHGAELLAYRGFVTPGTRVLRKPFTAEELWSNLIALNVTPRARKRA